MRRLKLSSDYGAGWPLWTDREGVADPAAHGVPADIRADLRAWQALFDTGFDPDSGWRGDAVERQYAHQAIDLLRRLRSALDADAEVTLDLWPLSTPSLIRWTEHRLAHQG